MYKEIKKSHQEQFLFANFYQSCHIGCKNYDDDDYKDAKNSHEEVKKYTDLFKNKLGYNKVYDITDKMQMN